MENLNLIRKIAWSFHHSSGVEFEDLFSEACVAYFEGLENYDPSKGKITTFMWTHITHHLRNYFNKMYRKQPSLVPMEELLNEPTYSITNLFEMLTPEAEEVAKIIIETSSETSFEITAQEWKYRKHSISWTEFMVGYKFLRSVFIKNLYNN